MHGLIVSREHDSRTDVCAAMLDILIQCLRATAACAAIQRLSGHINSSLTSAQQTMFAALMYPATEQKLFPPSAVNTRSRPLADDIVMSAAAVRRTSNIDVRSRGARVRCSHCPRSALGLNVVVRCCV